MWTTATVADVQRKGGEVYGILVYSGDAGKAAKEDFRLSQAELAASPKALERLALARLALFNAKTDFEAIQVGTSFDLTPKAAPEPTPSQQFFRELNRLYAVKAAASAGAVPLKDAQALEAAVAKLYDASFLADFGGPR